MGKVSLSRDERLGGLQPSTKFTEVLAKNRCFRRIWSNLDNCELQSSKTLPSWSRGLSFWFGCPLLTLRKSILLSYISIYPTKNSNETLSFFSPNLLFPQLISICPFVQMPVFILACARPKSHARCRSVRWLVGQSKLGFYWGHTETPNTLIIAFLTIIQ